MAVAPNSVTRLTAQYNVDGVDCQTSVHARNHGALTTQEWREDCAEWGNLFIQRWRTIQSTGINYTGASARVLGQPNLLGAGFTTTTTGQIAGIPLPAVHYIQVDLKGQAISAANRIRRNAWRLSGIAVNVIDDNCMREATVDSFRGLFGSLASTLYVGNSTWSWVIAFNVTKTSVEYDDMYHWSLRGAARVLSSRAR